MKMKPISKEMSDALRLTDNYAQRQCRKMLPDGHVVFECARCKRTIARTIDHEGRRTFQIRLKGSPKNDNESRYNIGGKCPNPKCQIGHDFTLHDIWDALNTPHEEVGSGIFFKWIVRTDGSPVVQITKLYEYKYGRGPDREAVVCLPDGTQEICSMNFFWRCFPDGSMESISPDGRYEYKTKDELKAAFEKTKLKKNE